MWHWLWLYLPGNYDYAKHCSYSAPAHVATWPHKATPTLDIVMHEANCVCVFLVWRLGLRTFARPSVAMQIV